ncbi:NAD(+) diphosphatase [Frateuria sp. STR12]|uniref:NAD(+) diphosphatase n=1 Tax=Frateuria hangzhouensis TaxID=2995589 RepID=UPI002260D382|nr:NAD(+) diphosphatase [Frateuria sp. STR12]MCX7513224.1 NAD(+) diphosphatase [Frateuria sp. STR12]
MSAGATNVFAGLSLVLDRMSERRDEQAWLAEQAGCGEARYLLLDPSGESYLLRDAESLRWLSGAERCELFAELPTSLLGIADGCPHFLLALDEGHALETLEERLAARRIGLREAGLRLPTAEAGLFAYAKGLAHWQRETRFCSGCGAPLERVAAGHRMKCTDASCGRLHFPRTDAAIIAIVEYEGACLLGRQAGWPKGRWSALAGFVEPGESLEDAVRREVAEEAGVRVGEVHYHSSQPWPLPASLMVGFIGAAIDPTIDLRDGELEDARWFTPGQIVAGLADGSFAPPTRLSVSYQLLADWLREHAGLELDALTT